MKEVRFNFGSASGAFTCAVRAGFGLLRFGVGLTVGVRADFSGLVLPLATGRDVVVMIGLRDFGVGLPGVGLLGFFAMGIGLRGLELCGGAGGFVAAAFALADGALPVVGVGGQDCDSTSLALETDVLKRDPSPTTPDAWGVRASPGFEEKLPRSLTAGLSGKGSSSLSTSRSSKAPASASVTCDVFSARTTAGSLANPR